VIKVNLLANSPGAAPPREWIPRAQRSAVAGFLMLVVTAAGVGGWWWYLRDQRLDVETRISSAEADLLRLKDVAIQVDVASARKAELTERLGLIDRLRAGKRGPVNLLETVSYSVPDGLWLLEIKQTGMFVQVDGRALSLTAVTDFARRMQDSGLFRHPVEILTTVAEVYEQTDVVRFVVRAEVADPSAPALTVDATAAVTARPGA
jgi:type IV pilus assembly protein PilN